MSDAVRIRFSLNTRCRFTEPAVNHVFRLRVLPAQTPGVTLTRETLIVSPQATLSAPLSEPLFGNRVVTGRIDAPHNTFEFTSEGEAKLVAVPDVTPPPLWLARPTPLTAAGPRVSELNRCVANGQDTEGTISSLLAAAHGALAYVKGSTTTKTGAEDALIHAQGVCQDFSHLFMALLRLRGIACRYCAGLVEGIGSTHAWVECWTGQKWLALDPTAGSACDMRYLVLSRGADFAHAAIERGVLKGGGTQTIETHATYAFIS